MAVFKLLLFSHFFPSFFLPCSLSWKNTKTFLGIQDASLGGRELKKINKQGVAIEQGRYLKLGGARNLLQTMMNRSSLCLYETKCSASRTSCDLQILVICKLKKLKNSNKLSVLTVHIINCCKSEKLVSFNRNQTPLWLRHKLSCKHKIVYSGTSGQSSVFFKTVLQKHIKLRIATTYQSSLCLWHAIFCKYVSLWITTTNCSWLQLLHSVLQFKNL